MFLLKFLLKLVVYFFTPVIISILILAAPFKIVRLCFLPSHRIGELAGLAAMYLLKKNKNNSFDIFFSGDLVANSYLQSYLKKKFFIVNQLFAHPVWKVLSYLKKKFIFFEKFIFYPTYKDKNFLLHKSKGFFLPKADMKKGEDFLKKLGIKKNDKIVCLIVRDKKYLNTFLPDTNFQYHNYRNCDISNYIKSIKYLISKNYYVFRMGVNYEKELRIKNKRFIDYSKKYRNAFLDIYLASRCEFVITSVTGWDIVPSYFFKKPVLWTNLAPYHACLPFLETSIFLPKHYFNIKNKKLSPWQVSEMILDPFNGIEYSKKGIFLKENTPVEILKATEEMFHQVNKKFYSNKDEKIINMWKKFNFFINKNSLIYNKNISPKGKFSRYFLNKNKKLLDI